MTEALLFAGFESNFAEVNGQRIFYRRGGRGTPVLLLHGFPQTHAMWHRVAPKLAEEFAVVVADLRGYGQSGKPPGTENYSFRRMAADQLALMEHLGVSEFHLVGHDRGGRVAHRLALDWPQSVTSLTLMDIVPTHHLLDKLDRRVAAAYYHWFFLAQPAPFAETLIGHDPDFFFESCLLGWGAARLEDFDPGALAAYRAAWRDPETIRGMCADYRAALAHDFEDDAGDLDRTVDVPALVLFGGDGAMAKAYDVPATWRTRLSNMKSDAIAGGHFFIDQSPAPTLAALRRFLQSV